jgi:hypothetical protein
MTVADQIASDAKFDETAFQWEHVNRLVRQFKRHLRPILLMVDFVSSLTIDPLVEAIDFMKLAFIKNRPLGQYPPNILPSQFISDSIKRHLYRQNVDEQKTLLVDRYEFLVYRLLRNSLEAGDIFCRESIRFRSLEDDLLDEQQ